MRKSLRDWKDARRRQSTRSTTGDSTVSRGAIGTLSCYLPFTMNRAFRRRSRIPEEEEQEQGPS